MIPRISTTWLNSISDSDLDTATHAILTGLTGSAFFPTPTPSLADLQVRYTTFTTALGIAKNGGKAETAAKNTARAALVDDLRDLGQDIDKTAAGNLEALLSSNYPLQKDRAPLDVQPAPANLRLKYGKVSGSAVGMCDVNTHRVMYEWQTSIGETPVDWNNEPPTTAARAEFSGHTPGTWLNARVRARVPAGAGDWSGVTRIMMI